MRAAPEFLLRPGMCSVACRALAADEVVRLAATARLEGIEWGADVHVPPGDLETARRVARWCADAGIEPASYGSYLCAGRDDGFAAVLETALELGATCIRVWAGDTASADADDDCRRRVADALTAASRSRPSTTAAR
jgi:sugar phosphate isomerase/epimerase